MEKLNETIKYFEHVQRFVHLVPFEAMGDNWNTNSFLSALGRFIHANEYDLNEFKKTVKRCYVSAAITLFLSFLYVIYRWNDRLWGRSIPPTAPGGDWGWVEEKFGLLNAIWPMSGALLIALVFYIVAFSARRKFEEQIGKNKNLIKSNLNELDSAVASASEKMKGILAHAVVIDSNIWMDKESDWFFSLIEYSISKNQKLTIHGEQFDEIVNLKKNSKYGEDKNISARIAINRIESFQKKGLCEISKITLNSRKGAYADPLLIKILCAIAKERGKAYMFTDNKSTRIRAREIVKNTISTYVLIAENPQEYLYPTYSLPGNMFEIW